MHRTAYSMPGTAPATLAAPEGHEGIMPIIHTITYSPAALHEEKPPTLDSIQPPDPSDNNSILWINIDGLGDVDGLRRLGQRFNLHPLALEDALNLEQRPKVDIYDHNVFIVTHMVYLDDEGICSEQLSLFLGPNYVITLQEEETRDVFGAVRKRLHAAQGYIRTHGSDYLAYALLDAVVDHYFPVLEAVGDAIETLETELLEKPLRKTVQRLYRHKRLLAQCRRYAWPQREVLGQLARGEIPLIADPTRVFLRDCYDHTIEIIDVIENYRDLTTGMMDLYLSSVSMRTNEVMRVLTVISSVFIPLTFIAGVYGMNFDTNVSHWNMPELENPYGYPLCVASMLLTAFGMIGFFRWKKWL